MKQLDYQTIKEALAGQGQLVLDIIAPLTPTQWQMPTKLPGWDVLTLVAHISRAPDGIIRYTASPVDTPAQVDWASYFRFDGSLIAADVSKRARETVAKMSPATIGADFKHTLNQALQILEQLAPTTVIKTIVGTIELADYAVTRVLELTVHSLDLTLALNQSPRFDPAAQALTVATLEALFGKPRTVDLADDMKFIAAATGRVPSSIRLPAFS